jgi:peptidyl-prolyl cis-trans isomerase C
MNQFAFFPDVIVNGVEIPKPLIEAEAKNHTRPGLDPGLVWRRAAEALTIRTLLLNEAERLELNVEPLELSPGRLESQEEALIRETLDQLIEDADVSKDDCWAVYSDDPDAYRAPDLYEAAHILFAADPKDRAQRIEKKALAEAALSKIQKSPKLFSQLAKELSACPSAANGGLLGQLGPGDTVPEFEAALAVMDEGSIHGPVETRYGFHLLRLDAKAVGAILPFEKVLPQIEKQVSVRNWAIAAKSLAANLIQNADIVGLEFPNLPTQH